ncbi:MAG: hypothetical protein ACJ77K_13290 [Bacteroidia bacterium]
MDKIRYYSNFFMIAVYFSLGLLFFFTDIAEQTFPDYRKELGCTMIVYAGIRTFMVIRKHKREKGE